MFLKNVSGQRVGAQMIDKLTGDNITSGVTCYVTVDGGTQALGATGSGVCVHEGNGYHTYVPTSGEANGETVAFTFVATGAVTVTKEIYPFNVSVLSENIWDILESSANVSESMGRLLHDALTAATAAAGQAAAALAQGATNEVDIAAIQADLDAKLDVAVSSISPGASQPRVNYPAGKAYRLTISSRADDTYVATRPVKLRPGEITTAGGLPVSVDMSPLYGDTFVANVGTPTVSGGSITASALGPRDTTAMIALDGVVTASEERTCTFEVTMATGEIELVTIEIEAFGE